MMSVVSKAMQSDELQKEREFHRGNTVARKFSYSRMKTQGNQINNIQAKFKQALVADVRDVAKEHDIKVKSVKNQCLSLCLGSVLYQSLEKKFEALLPLLQ